MEAKQFTLSDVSQHNKEDDCWIVIHGKVFDVTSFLNEHPGGKKVILRVAGQDATQQFDQFHNKDVLIKYGPNLFKGEISEPTSKKIYQPPRDLGRSDEPREAPMQKISYTMPDSTTFGEMIPYGDPSWYQGWKSPFFNETHIKFRQAMREFVEKEVMPFCHEWDEAMALPKEFYRKVGDAGILSCVCGPPWPSQYVDDIKLPGGIKPDEYDAFHELILIDEMSRCGSGGILWGISGGLTIGLPPILLFGSDYLKEKVCRPCFTGEKIICLAITEPHAGSDVANLKCEAELTPDGKHYIVNGEKKWITNGVFADFFTVAVRTGGKGMGGISLLLLERGMPGITTKQMKCSGVWPSGTTYITFEDVKVPISHLIGKENQGFKYIMANFNHERWTMCVSTARFSRVCLEESIKYAFKRKTFGQRLIDHPVIRFKLGHMARQIEATQAWLEYVTYQMTIMSKSEGAKKLGGPIALLKAQCTQTFEFCAREAAQIFGGLAYTRGGQGEKVERLYREVRAYAIPGGSEEIMIDLGVRQAMRKAKL